MENIFTSTKPLEVYCVLSRMSKNLNRKELHCICENEDIAKVIASKILGIPLDMCVSIFPYQAAVEYLTIISKNMRGYLDTSANDYKKFGDDIKKLKFQPYYIRNEKIDLLLE